jgi:hypothetical protein
VTIPLTLPFSTPPLLRPTVCDAQDFYEHLSLSEKIVRGRVQLELPHPETSDDEEEMWSKWEAKNHERYVRERMVRDREGLASRARELGPMNAVELRELKQKRKGPNGYANGEDGEPSVDPSASLRRRPRSATDKTYKRLLHRSRRNSERVKEAFRFYDQARVDEAIALRDTHVVSLSPSPSRNAQSRSPGERSRGSRGSPPVLKRSGDGPGFPSPTPSRASSSKSKARVSISLQDVDSDSDQDASSSAEGSEEDGNARVSRVTSQKSASEFGFRTESFTRPRGRAASVAGFPTTPSLRAAASASLRARSASPPRRRAARISTAGGFVSPGSPAESRALALAIAENDEILAVAGYDVPGAARSGVQSSDERDLVAFGQHWTTHGEAARARREAERDTSDEVRKTRRPFTARATTTFRPPRLYTSSRPDERVRSRAATARAWAKQELTEAVVLRTVGSVYGEPGVARHWDDPTRAAAEQAAAKMANESLLTHGDVRLANKAAREAARVAAARAARLVHADGSSAEDALVETLLSGETRELRSSKKGKARARKPFVNAAVLATRSAGDSSGYSDEDSDSAAVSSVSVSSTNATESERDGDSTSGDEERSLSTSRGAARRPGSATREPGAEAFAAFRSELAAIDAEAATRRLARRAASEPTSPRGGEKRNRMKGPGFGRAFSRPASAKHGLGLVRDSLERTLRRARGSTDSASAFDSASVSVRARAGSVRSARSARSAVDDPAGRATPTRTFLRSGQGGAGMARGRSVAALEELSDPAHAARLRRQLETAAGPALAAARAEQAKAAARVGLAQARLRARAAEAADAEARAREARRRARRDASARTFKSPLFGASNAGSATHRAAIGVVDAGTVTRVSRPSTASRPASASARANRPSRPAFSASPFAPSTGARRERFHGSPASPYSPIPRVYPAAEARARAEAEAEAAFAEAHRRAIAESPRDKSGFGFGAAGATPASARASSSGTPRFFAAARRPSSAGKHGLQLVRESLDEELEKARGVRG